MSTVRSWLPVVGLVMHVLIGGLMLFAGSMKVFGMVPPTELPKMAGVGDNITLIGCGAIVSAILLIVPRTASLGILLCSGFFGGTIAFHMYRQETYLPHATFLLLVWVGAYLRYPAMFASFWEGVQTSESKTDLSSADSSSA